MRYFITWATCLFLICILSVIPAIAQDFTDQFLDLNDNQIPAGWTLDTRFGGPGINNGRLEGHTVDGRAILVNKGTVPAGVNAITFEYEGNINYSFWGMDNGLFIMNSDSTIWEIIDRMADFNFGNVNVVHLRRFDNPTGFFSTNGANLSTTWSFPLEYTSYKYTMVLTDGTIQYKAERLSDGQVLYDFPIDITGFVLSELTEFAFKVRTTTNTNAWIDNLAVTLAYTTAPPIVTLDALPVDPIAVGSSLHASGTFVDIDDDDMHSGVWDWGDGNSSGATIDQSINSIADSHVYTETGVYTLALTITDSDLLSDSVAHQYVVVYDPDGGFVTGGGWIDSPAGALASDSSLVGKVNFGFSSKYKKNETLPTGNTVFNFDLADLEFKSTSYDWLVITDEKAQYSGSGSINDAGNYGFLFTVTDADLSPSTDDDLFRIKIWDRSNGDALVYDNQINEDDNSDAGTTLGGGNIKIHAGNGSFALASLRDRLSETANALPTDFQLSANYPNPFNPSTTIRFSLPVSSPVRLAVFDVLGKRVHDLVNEVRDAGVYEVTFDASTLSSGTYLYRLDTPTKSITRRMLLLK